MMINEIGMPDYGDKDCTADISAAPFNEFRIKARKEGEEDHFFVPEHKLKPLVLEACEQSVQYHRNRLRIFSRTILRLKVLLQGVLQKRCRYCASYRREDGFCEKLKRTEKENFGCIYWESASFEKWVRREVRRDQKFRKEWMHELRKKQRTAREKQRKVAQGERT